MENILTFTDRAEFRSWLSANCQSTAGVWLLFGKTGGPKTLKAGEALEEALCFGWIDGQMQPCAGKTASGPKRTKPWSRAWRSGGL